MKKGFTLVEILAVIAILGIITMIITPAIGGIIQTSKEKAYDKQIETIVNAAKSYMTENSVNLPAVNKEYTTTVCELEKEGYLKVDNIVNPIYQEGSTEEDKKCKYLYGNITVTNEAGKFKYQYTDADNCNDYIQLIADSEDKVKICDQIKENNGI